MGKLPVSQRHTGCPYCNYQGCVWKREKHPIMGHWLWVADYKISYLKKFLNLKRQTKRLINYLTRLDYSQIDNIELDGIDTRDYPDFCDAFISYAEYKGKPMSDKQLDRLNDDGEFIYEKVIERLF